MRRSKVKPFISELWLANFRSFRRMNEAIPLRQLTFIVGPNSSGKSSLMHAILFLTQSELLDLRGTSPSWSGPLTDLGSYEDTVYGHYNQRRIEIEISLTGIVTEPISVHYIFSSSSGDPVGIISEAIVRDETTGFAVSVRRKRGRGGRYSIRANESKKVLLEWSPIEEDFRKPSLIGAIHIALGKLRSTFPRRSNTYKAIMRLRRLWSYELYEFSLGTQRVASGRLPPHRWYARRGEDTLGSSSQLDRVDPAILTTQREFIKGRQPKLSIERLLSELEMVSSIKAARLSAYHTSIKTRDFITGIEANLTDVGYGISQSIPVLKALTGRTVSPLFVEQPEIHLHPIAQGTLAEKLCLASRERQVVVETHSERVINRARILVAEDKLKPEHVQILYVDKTKNGSRVTPIGLDKLGNFTTTWPSGFFDERYEDSMTLFHLQTTKQ